MWQVALLWGIALVDAIAPTAGGATPGLISLPLRQVSAPKLLKRGLPHQSLLDLSYFYAADFQIGTPPQRVALIVDTGSWFTWVNPYCRRAADTAMCNGLPSYNQNASTPTAKRVAPLDQIVDYGGGWGAVLQGYSDVFTWGNDTKVVNQTFGVANYTVGVSFGVLSLGIDGVGGFGSEVSNRTVIGTMFQQGLINSRAFSLAIGTSTQVKDHTGSLVFGGIDRSRFSGTLFSVPILPEPEVKINGWRYWVQVTRIKNNRADQKQGYQTNITGWNSKFAVDSGTTGLFLARDIFNSLLSDMGLQKAPAGEEFPSIPCNRKADNASIEFGFGVNSIKIPYSALIFPRGNSKTDCVLAMGTAGNATDDADLWSNLGLGFLHGTYSVFDWDNQAIHFAQAANCAQPDLVPIGSGPKAVNVTTGNCK